ncbi:inner membrane protein YbjM [Pantoea alhagi]|uniref:inner membrane protein YbjM n=1 Tax=Pantoea alhagi TaxID=1891675 RepID=UPI00202AC71A|nr:inner membrane protein YbjM [Pantoea alhagi]URQ62006.1 inner membrane protein YbjM [Pantoea alhagi]
MLLYSVRWPGVVICMTLYCATFFVTRYGGAEETPGQTSEQTGLLLFMLPGLIAAMINRHTPLAQALMAAVAATPFCMLMGISGTFMPFPPLQELAWMTSAIFWCGFGALLVMLWRTLAASRITR